MTDDASDASDAFSRSSPSPEGTSPLPEGKPESVEETLGRMQRTLQRIHVEAPGDTPSDSDGPGAEPRDADTQDADTQDADTQDADTQDAETLTATGGDREASGGGDGLARLVLTLVQLLHDVLERQAIRRMENDTLTPDEVERIGQALMKQAEEIRRICEAFGIDPNDLDIDLGTVHMDDPST